VLVSTGHEVTDTPNVVSSVEINKVFSQEGVVTLPMALVGFVLAQIHKVHILDPALISAYDEEPNAGRDVNKD